MKTYPTDVEIAKVMEDRKLNRIGAVQFRRRQAAKSNQLTQPVELNAKLAELGDKAPHIAQPAKKAKAPKAAKPKKAKPEYGDYTPSAKKQEEIDSLVNSAVRKAFGKVVAKVACIGLRNSFSKKGGAPYQRYVLANDHTVFVGGIHNDNLTVSVSEKKLDPKSFTGRRYFEKQARLKARAAKTAAKESK